MAYVQNDPNAPELDQNQGQMPAPAAGAQAMGAAPATSSGGPAGAKVGGGAGSPQGVTAMPGSTQAPPVQDLHAYLDANQPQSVQMGKNIAGNLDQTRQAAVGDINAAQQSVGDLVQGQNIAPDAALVSRAAADPTNFVSNADDLTKFQAQRDAAYKGPANFAGTKEFDTANRSVQSALSKAPDVNQAQGVEQLVRGQEKNPTAGMSNLDALLLQGTPDSMAPIKSSIAGFKDLPGQLTSAGDATDAAIKAAIDNTTAAAGGVKGAFLTGPNAVVPAWEKALAAELPEAQKGYDAYNAGVNKIIGQQNEMNPLVSAEQNALKEYNAIFPNNPEYQFSGDFAPLVKTPAALTTAPTQQSVATANDYAMEQALQQLLGGGFGPAPLDPAHAGEAGTWKLPTAPSLPVSGSEQMLQAIIDRMTSNPAGGTRPRVPVAQNVFDSSNALLNYLKGMG